jgi:uncharacterized membrane protein YfcA
VTVFAISGAIIGGLLSLDSARDALYVMGPVCFVFLVFVLWYLVRAARAASRGEFYRLPAWLCLHAGTSAGSPATVTPGGVGGRHPQADDRVARPGLR